MLTLLAEPNVLLLDEPTNDVDTEMLAATEDLLDSWPGTLIVVSHDRYLLERVTDQQYAILDGRLRHLPGGVDEYLRLAAQAAPQRGAAPATSASRPQAISGAELRATEKEIAAIDRRLARLADQIAAKHQELADHDQSDHVGITRLTQELRGLEDDVAGMENRWLELSEVLE
jgi:ABC-type multidrug transport system ATPase subunit